METFKRDLADITSLCQMLEIQIVPPQQITSRDHRKHNIRNGSNIVRTKRAITEVSEVQGEKPLKSIAPPTAQISF